MYKRRGTLLYPFTCARAVGAAPTAAPSRTGEVNRGETEAQDSQSNAKAKNTKKQRGEAGSPGRTLAGAARPHQQSEPPLSPRVPTQPVTLELGLGRHLHGGMQIFVKTRNTQDQMRIRRRRSSARSLPRKATKTPGKTLAGDDNTTRRDPCRATRQGPHQGRQ